MKFERIDDVVLTRRLILSGVPDAVMVEIGRPVSEPDGTHFCPYRVLGLGRDRIWYGAGVDPVQALFLALKNIGAELYTSEAYRDGKLHWLAVGNRDLGFPVPDGSGLGPEVD